MCDCIVLTNEKLRERGLRLTTVVSFRRDKSIANEMMGVATEKIDSRDRKAKPITIIGAFCSFCGEGLEAKDA